MTVTLQAGRQLLNGGRCVSCHYKAEASNRGSHMSGACGVARVTLPSSSHYLKQPERSTRHQTLQTPWPVQNWSTSPWPRPFRLPQRSPPLPGDKPRASKVAASRNHCVARGKKERILPRPCQIWYNTCEEARGKGVRGRSHNAPVQLSPGFSCPLTSPAPGRRHLASPAYERGGTSCSSLPAPRGR